MGERRGVAFIFSAPSGAGKTTLAQRLLSELDGIQPSISTTTRKPRPGEQEGRDYFYTDIDSFKTQIEVGRFLEYAEVFGNYYGTSRASVESMLSVGVDVILDIDWQGARQIRANMPQEDVVSLFIAPPGLDVLRERLEGRGQDDAEVIDRRMAQAYAEMSHWNEYDYLVINDDLEQAGAEMLSIIRAERIRSRRMKHQALRILQEGGSADTATD